MPPLTRRLALACLAAAGAGLAYGPVNRLVTRRQMQALYTNPLTKPEVAMQVFHLGHSLVGRDMPAMLAQLCGPAHHYHSQLGWGTSLKQHWEPGAVIQGFAQENAHPHFRDAHEAIGSGEYDAVVLTEMVEIRDAIRHHDSAEYLARWAALAHDANPETRIYLYETWHHTNDADGWMTRIEHDLPAYWQGAVKYPAMRATGAPIHLIPAGQVMAAFVRAVERAGGVKGISSLHDLFAKAEDGMPDTIHFNDLGAYLVALAHYAVIHHRDPRGLPFALRRADGTAAVAPSAAAAALMQRTVWQVVTQMPETGVAA